MAQKVTFPEVHVAVALVVRESRIFAVYNSEWSSFTLPMTKRRYWSDPNIPPAERDEEWIEAGARAAAEWLGTTVTGLTALNADLPPYQQSDRDGIWKRYDFRLFRLGLPAGCQPRGDVITQWLSVAEFLDEDRRPISKTARHIVAALNSSAKLAGGVFP
jgi:hypothetical protein